MKAWGLWEGRESEGGEGVQMLPSDERGIRELLHRRLRSRFRRKHERDGRLEVQRDVRWREWQRWGMNGGGGDSVVILHRYRQLESLYLTVLMVAL